MRKRTTKFWLPMIVLAFSPAVAYADAGTPLLWATGFHLLIGNALIGIAEGMVLAALFRQTSGKTVAIMIVANYFSAWVGGLFLSHKLAESLNLDLYNARSWLWGMVAITYVLTLLLEWPFVALCLRNSDGWFRKSIWGSLIVQSASYVVLFGWYWAASGTSLYTALAVVQPSAITLPKDAMLYYVADKSGDVYAQNLGQGDTRKIGELTSVEYSDQLILQQSRTVAGRWDLVVDSKHWGELSAPSPSARIVSAGLTGTAAEPPWARILPGGDVARFRVADKSGWQFRFGWMAARLDGENVKEGKMLDVSLDTPFVRWPIFYPTQLPSGQVVFQLGENQICILDPNERTIALLVKGRCPVITMKDGLK